MVRSRFDLPTRNFNPHSHLRGVTQYIKFKGENNGISIHTPFAGSDVGGGAVRGVLHISIHTPFAGSDDELLNQ